MHDTRKTLHHVDTCVWQGHHTKIYSRFNDVGAYFYLAFTHTAMSSIMRVWTIS